MKTVLVVEEEAHQRLLYTWELGDEGYRVVTAVDIDEAVVKIGNEPPDCIVLGVNPGHRENPTMIQNFLESGRGIPVIVNTTHRDCGGEAIWSLVDDCVVKSSDIEKLKQHVQMMLDGGSASQYATVAE